MELDRAFEALGLMSRKPEGQLLATDFTKVRIAMSEKVYELNEKTQRQVEKKWKEHLASHPNDFDGLLASLHQCTLVKGELFLVARSVAFSVFYATRPEQSVCLEGVVLDKDFPLPLSVGAITRTSDNCIVVGQRSQTAFNRHEYTFLPGGYLDPDRDSFIERLNKKITPLLSPKLALGSEFSEELRYRDFTFFRWLGLVFSCVGSKQPLLAATLETPKTSQQVISLSRYGLRDENKKIFCVPADLASLKEFVSTHWLCSHDVWKLALWVAVNY